MANDHLTAKKVVPDLKNEAECRVVFSEIVNGFSRDASETIFLKHYNELDLSYTEYLRQKFMRAGASEGLISEAEKLDLLREKGHWSAEEEKKYQELLEEVNQMRYSLKALVIPQQITHLNSLITEKEKSLGEFALTRYQLLGMTLEQYAIKRSSESHTLRSFFKDPELKMPYFSNEDIDDLSLKEVGVYIDIYHTTHGVFFDKNFKRIAVCAFFLNGYNMCADNPMIFYGRPVTHLTLYQISLFSKGRYFKNILTDPEAKHPPEEYYQDLDKVVKFYDSQYSIILGKRTNNQLIK